MGIEYPNQTLLIGFTGRTPFSALTPIADNFMYSNLGMCTKFIFVIRNSNLVTNFRQKGQHSFPKRGQGGGGGAGGLGAFGVFQKIHPNLGDQRLGINCLHQTFFSRGCTWCLIGWIARKWPVTSTSKNDLWTHFKDPVKCVFPWQVPYLHPEGKFCVSVYPAINLKLLTVRIDRPASFQLDIKSTNLNWNLSIAF